MSGDISGIKEEGYVRISLRRRGFAFINPATQYLIYIYVRQSGERKV